MKGRLICCLIFPGLFLLKSKGSNPNSKIFHWVTSDLYYCPPMCHHFSSSFSPSLLELPLQGMSQLHPVPGLTGNKMAFVPTQALQKLSQLQAGHTQWSTCSISPPQVKIQTLSSAYMCHIYCVSGRTTSEAISGNSPIPAPPRQWMLESESLQKM